MRRPFAIDLSSAFGHAAKDPGFGALLRGLRSSVDTSAAESTAASAAPPGAREMSRACLPGFEDGVEGDAGAEEEGDPAPLQSSSIAGVEALWRISFR
mmetsp:Transcript_12874/g.34898  ORF Transcript_12874/g.34898 Transcript_12874/m.34898 type:complete len:98 (+) Transcript_12874:167-460(+)